MTTVEGYFGPTISQFEKEVRLWRKLHNSLGALLDIHRTPVPEYEDHNLCQSKVPLTTDFGDWYVYIRQKAEDEVQADGFVNRWGQSLTSPIEVSLWVGDDGEPYDRTITDDPKAGVMCSPRGVVDLFTKLHVSMSDLEALIVDTDIYRPLVIQHGPYLY